MCRSSRRWSLQERRRIWRSNSGREERSIRGRWILLFVLGFLAGALTLYYVLWRTGGLTPGHPLARRTVDLPWVRGADDRPSPAPATRPPETQAIAPLAAAFLSPTRVPTLLVPP